VIVHEEFDISLQAPNGGKCVFCASGAEHGLFIKDDHDRPVFSHPDLCPVHVLYFVMCALTEGMDGVKDREKQLGE